MKFSEIVKQAVMLLQESQRVTYRALKLEFALDEDQLATLKEERIEGQRVARDEGDKVLVWTGPPTEQPTAHEAQLAPATPVPPVAARSPAATPGAEAERRQLTVMFCDLVG